MEEETIIPIMKDEAIIGFFRQENGKPVLYTCERAGWAQVKELIHAKDTAISG